MARKQCGTRDECSELFWRKRESPRLFIGKVWFRSALAMLTVTSWQRSHDERRDDSDMVRIVKHHGLVPVPVDLDFETLAPTIESLDGLRTEHTRLIVIAPLFGASIPMEPIVKFAREHDIIVVEDCAQSFRGWNNVKSTTADIALYSFGPIKTSTALGGAVAVVHNESLLSHMRRVQEAYPIQSRFDYAKRIAKYSILKLASARPIYSIVFALIKTMGLDPDSTINQLAKNFSPGELIKRIRTRPANALVAVLARRQRTYPKSRIDKRIDLGERLASRIKQGPVEHLISIPGAVAIDHSHWVFPAKTVMTDRALIRIQKHGFDVTRKHNLTVVESVQDFVSGDVPEHAGIVFPHCFFASLSRAVDSRHRHPR